MADDPRITQLEAQLKAAKKHTRYLMDQVEDYAGQIGYASGVIEQLREEVAQLKGEKKEGT